MLRGLALALLGACAVVLGCSSSETTPPFTDPGTTFFVSSDASAVGDLGGFEGADARCQRLAEAAGIGDHTWHAYLGSEAIPAKGIARTDPRDRIGKGPWTNAAGATLADDVASLHQELGDYTLFIDEYSQKIPGFWPDSPSPAQHDVLTGANVDGTVLEGKTCEGWTSSSSSVVAMVGHTDGLDSTGARSGTLIHWNAAHLDYGCNDTQPGGGAGRIYCFAADVK